MSSNEALDARESVPGSALLSDTALSALALREQPFAPGATDDDPFTDEVTAEQLADIRQALITGDDLLLVLGEDGAGKSTLLSQLAANSGLRIQCFSVGGSPRFSTRNLFMGMLEAFKIEPPEDLKETLDELVPCLQAMIAGNKLCVVVLDDAETLAEHELTTLLSSMLYVNSRDESLLRIALSAVPAFEDRIPDLLPEGADLPYSSLSLEPLDAERAAAYLDFRLGRAGRADGLPLDENEIARLNERAGGLPGALHAVAAAALENAWGEPGAAPSASSAAVAPPPDARPADADLPPELRPERRPERRPLAAGIGLDGRGTKLALGALAGALIIGGLLLFRTAPEPGTGEERYRVVEQRPVETDRETERLELLEEGERERAAAAVPPADDADGLAASDEAGATSVPVTEADLSGAAPARAPEPDLAAAPDPDSASSAAVSVPTPAAPSSEPEPGPEPSPASEPAPEPEPEPASEPVPEPAPEPVSEEPVPEPAASAPEPAAAPGTEDAGGTTDDAGGTARTDAVPRGDEEESPSPVAPPPEEPRLGALESPNWVLVQNPAQYTVQMSASTDRASVEEFLERAGLPAPNSIFSFDRGGRTWYALVHGLYPDIDEARDAIERMPSVALVDQPWIRAVGRIQETLREQN